jgi:hypothetical protein
LTFEEYLDRGGIGIHYQWLFYADEHINDVIFNALRNNTTGSMLQFFVMEMIK